MRSPGSIEAEAQLMGNDDVGAAETALKEAITASLEKIVGVADMDYVNTNGGSVQPGNQGGSTERIMTQKYIALYSHGLEC